MSKKIVMCPHCSSDDGVYTKTTYVNVPYFFHFNGDPQDNSEMYDNVESFSGGKTVYCQNCNKPICRYNTLKRQWDK